MKTHFLFSIANERTKEEKKRRRRRRRRRCLYFVSIVFEHICLSILKILTEREKNLNVEKMLTRHEVDGVTPFLSHYSCFSIIFSVFYIEGEDYDEEEGCRSRHHAVMTKWHQRFSSNRVQRKIPKICFFHMFIASF